VMDPTESLTLHALGQKLHAPAQLMAPAPAMGHQVGEVAGWKLWLLLLGTREVPCPLQWLPILSGQTRVVQRECWVGPPDS
jgi:hypothetical protein